MAARLSAAEEALLLKELSFYDFWAGHCEIMSV
jgi:hypothetical protein